MGRTLKRILAFILGSLLAITGMDIPFSIIGAQAEEFRDFVKVSNNIVPADYPNILNISYEEYELYNRINKINKVIYLLASINCKETVLQVYFDTYSYYNASLSIDTNDFQLSDEELKKRIDRIKIALADDASLKDDEFLLCDEYYDHITGKSLGVHIIGYGFVPNEEFFSSKEIVSVIKKMTHEELIEYFSIDYEKLDLPEYLLEKIKQNKFMTLAEEFEVLLKMLPKEYWPIITESKVNTNTTLPIFKDEILDQELKDDVGMAIMETNSGERRIMLFKYVKEGHIFYDYFTGVLVSSDNKYLNIEYANHYNITKNGVENLPFFSQPAKKIWVWLMGSFPDQFDEYRRLKTHRDLVTWYQKIPLEKQVDYSFYDYSKSPNPDIDPDWLANRPVPPPTPTPPPYHELRVGSSGQAVLDMKQRFYELGYFRTDEFSDQFNANTADTVKLFEKNNSLPVDGIADAGMLGVLFSDRAVGK